RDLTVTGVQTCALPIFYSVYVGPLCGRSGAVHAFEANPRLIPHLSRSIALNQVHSNIRLNAVAVGNQSGASLPLYDPDRIGCSRSEERRVGKEVGGLWG